MKLKGRRFETVSDIQRESQAVLDSIKENDFHCAFEARKNPVYVSKETVLKEMAEKLSKLIQHLFFDLVREFSDKPRTSRLMIDTVFHE
jgi:hypothetical protein